MRRVEELLVILFVVLFMLASHTSWGLKEKDQRDIAEAVLQQHRRYFQIGGMMPFSNVPHRLTKGEAIEEAYSQLVSVDVVSQPKRLQLRLETLQDLLTDTPRCEYATFVWRQYREFMTVLLPRVLATKFAAFCVDVKGLTASELQYSRDDDVLQLCEEFASKQMQAEERQPYPVILQLWKEFHAVQQFFDNNQSL